MFLRIKDTVINTDMVEMIEKVEEGLLFSFAGNDLVIQTNSPDETIKQIMRTMNQGFSAAVFREV